MDKTKEKEPVALNTTQDIAIHFAQQAISAINGQLAVEIKRNGFSMEKIRKGKLPLIRRVGQSETDKRFLIETFAVEFKKGQERIIMAVKWLANRYEIEVNSDAVANAVAANPAFKMSKKSASSIVTEQMTEREIEIEARANEYEKKEEERLKKTLKVT